MNHFVLIVLFFYCFSAFAQDQKGYVSFSPYFSHYIPKTSELQLGDVPYNVCPGIELLYNYQLSTSGKLATGLSYQYASIISHANSSDKFVFGELSLPVLLTFTEKNNRLSLVTGIYAGKFLHFEWYKMAHSQWSKATYYDPRFGYKAQNAFADLYLAVSYSINKNDPHHTSISPFVKYRIGENWMDLYRESFYYGFKFTINMYKLNN